jgi:magnesium chelatase subunit D
VRRRLAFDADPEAFVYAFAADEAELAAAITAARELLPKVELDDEALEKIAAVCAAFEVDGLRADIVTARAASAHAAWAGRTTVTTEDIRVAARLALPHRRRRNPFDAPGLDEQRLDDALGQDDEPEPPEPDGDGRGGDGGGNERAGEPGEGSDERGEQTGGSEQRGGSGPAGSSERVAAPADTFRTRRLEVPGVGAGTAGRRSRARTGTGRTVGAEAPAGRIRHLHLSATLAAAAPHQRSRGRDRAGLRLRRSDLREARREGREANLVLFAVDASGSMAARARMSAVKGAVLSLLLDAYQRRDKVGLVSFRGGGAELLLPPTSSVDAAAARLTALPTGGRTPLRAGLLLAAATLERERLRDPERRPLLVVVTDGRYTSGGDPAPAADRLRRAGIASVVVDCETGPVRLGLAGRLAEQLGGSCLRLAELGQLADSVRALREVA